MTAGSGVGAAPPPRERPQHIAVVGSSEPGAELVSAAEEVGRRLAHAGAIVVCGGLGGVMEAVCRGAKGARGVTIGILPGLERGAANPFVDLAVATGLGEARNALVARAGDAMVALGGGYGTLAEIAFALRVGRAVIGFDTWELAQAGRPIEAIARAGSPEEAVELALARASEASSVGGGSASGAAGYPR